MKKVTSYKTYGEKITVFYMDAETEESGWFDIYAATPDADETPDSYETLFHEELMHEYEMYELTDPSEYWRDIERYATNRVPDCFNVNA